MTGLLDVFLSPAADRSVRAAGPVSVPAEAAPCAVVLGGPGEAGSVARLLAAHLRRRLRTGCALVAEWHPQEAGPPRGGSATRPAHALEQRLQARGLEPAASGRLVGLTLAAEPETAASEWRRAVAAAGCPTVCALDGPRPAAFDAPIDEADLIVLVLGAAASAALADLALDALAGVRAPVVRAAPVAGGLWRLLSSSSLGTAHALGAELTDAVRSL